MLLASSVTVIHGCRDLASQPNLKINFYLLDQVKTMEENLLKLKKGDLRAPVHRLEIQRIKFMVNSYLRLRLFKIQKNVFHVTKTSDDNPSRMTPEEAEFAGNYRQMMQEHRYKREFRTINIFQNVS